MSKLYNREELKAENAIPFPHHVDRRSRAAPLCTDPALAWDPIHDPNADEIPVFVAIGNDAELILVAFLDGTFA
jgi:hypothetical protein